MSLRLQLIDNLDAVDPGAWDVLTGDDDPFVEHAFLAALERSGSVGGSSGWQPLHVTLWEGEALVGALPLYLKDHSFGEFVFDWGWADAAERAGIGYYPKLVSMAPLTPATGRRLLVHPEAERTTVQAALAQGALEAAKQTQASSVHLLFLNEQEGEALAQQSGWMPRLTMQFHWQNQDYDTFDDFLASLRAPLRKQVRKERRGARASGLEICTRTGDELTADDWRALLGLYRDTCARKGSVPYLTADFFLGCSDALKRRAVAAMAYRDGQLVAASLNFEKGQHLYGRYWGAFEQEDFLHFELCYYRLIERAIERGMTRFEAGAQGIHKLRRGLMPAPIYSAHWIRHPLLRAAVEAYLPQEAAHTRAEMADLARHGPFRRG